MNTFYKNLSMWLVIGLTMILLFNVFNKPQGQSSQMTYSEFWSSVESGVINRVTIQGEKIIGTGQDGRPFSTVAPDDTELIPMLRESGVDISVKEPERDSLWMSIFISWFPMLLLIGVWIFFMRQMQVGGKGGALSFGKTRAKLREGGETKVTFKDVAGIDESKAELEEIIDFLRDPQKFTKLGGRIPKGVLLAGSPGTGKTLLARAIAGEAEVPFFTISGSDFVEMFVGVGASRVRDLFNQGKKNAPCIIFIDEIDAVGRHRGAGLGGGHDEREQTLNQLLVEMDGFDANEGVIIIAATNRPDVLDPALLRPGRFDRQVVVPVPDIKGREKILEIYGKKTKLSKDVDLAVIARGTPGFSGADLENLINEAALMAARAGENEVSNHHLELAKDKIMMGTERKSMIISDREKEVTAYHEAGHALVARLLPDTDPIHKVTIIPRGRALGLTMQLPVDEKYTHSKDYLQKTICILFGGRVAERLIFDEITTGAGNDLERATDSHDQQQFEQEKLGGFIQAQSIWDEAMAESIVDYLQANPEKRMVIIAGNGHVYKDSAIPPRVARRMNVPQSVLSSINFGTTGLVPGYKVDYLVYTQPVELEPAPKVGVVLKTENIDDEPEKTRLRILQISPHGKALEAGIKEKDIILAIDGQEVETVSDMKILLMDKRPGDTVTLRVLREHMLFEDERFDIDVELSAPMQLTAMPPSHPK